MLLVEDSRTVRALVRQMLEDLGHTVEVSTDGVEAFLLLKENLFDLIITDLVMSKKDGIELISQVRRSSPQIKIIAISGTSFSQAYLKTAKRVGADRFLIKPFDQDQLRAAIEDLESPSHERRQSPHFLADLTEDQLVQNICSHLQTIIDEEHYLPGLDQSCTFSPLVTFFQHENEYRQVCCNISNYTGLVSDPETAAVVEYFINRDLELSFLLREYVKRTQNSQNSAFNDCTACPYLAKIS